MKIVFKRAVAYMIDMLIVSAISTLIASNAYINKDYKNYINTYEEYDSFYEKYENSIEDLQESLEDEEITQDEYDTELEKINNSYNDKNIEYNYKLIKFSIVSTIISILVILIYFVVIQYYFNGKTLGKWIMKLRVVSNNDKKLNILNYLLRSLILNSVLINILTIIFVVTLSKNNYLIANEIIYVVNYVMEIAIVFMMFFDKNNRGLQDYVANTKVIYEGVE
ncbi:MAG: RDD family protein [Bacilli bacterium]|nr:RDD family protein [Bacilli bacterium]